MSIFGRLPVLPLSCSSASSARSEGRRRVAAKYSSAATRSALAIKIELKSKNRSSKIPRKEYRSGNTEETLMNARLEPQKDRRATCATDEAKWQAVVRNDRDPNVKFYYSVSTPAAHSL